ncbi:MAG: DUF4160 domain-containing protein [Gracilibacteraceae bacterium]|jgi:hypothetical protein|nr:DUF4160 domain-containing protein [Gracilibacteraceae bacterium]
MFGYTVYFWSNERGEPMHVHMCRGAARPNATKVWILENGRVSLEHNKSNIPLRDLNKLLRAITDNIEMIETEWNKFFN